MNKYDSLPDPPADYSAVTVLSRLLDGIGFRFNCATDGLTEHDLEHCASPDGWPVEKIITHIHRLMSLVAKSLGVSTEPYDSTEGFDEMREATLGLISDMSARLKEMSEDDLDQIILRLGKDGELEFSFWFAINGPIADALTHIGQINVLRRACGNPVIKYSPLMGTKG